MTVSTTHIENSFTADGTQTTFNFTFQVQEGSTVQVFVDGAIVTVGFSVQVNSNQRISPGGNVVFTAPPANLKQIKAKRKTPLTQTADFLRDSILNTEKLEYVFDRQTMLLQEAMYANQGQVGPQGPPGPQGPAGTMSGPGTSINNALAVYNGNTGSSLKQGPVPLNDGDTIKVSGGQWVAAASSGASLPSGSMMLWDTNMAAIPTGWAPMDGRTVTINGVSKVTIDTRGKYLLCAAQADAGSSGYTGATVRPGTVAGTKSHVHDQGGSVVIGAAGSNDSIGATGIAVGAGPYAGSAVASAYLVPGSHSHAGGLSGSVQNNSEDQRPIEVALLIIVKVD